MKEAATTGLLNKKEDSIIAWASSRPSSHTFPSKNHRNMSFESLSLEIELFAAWCFLCLS